MKSYVNKMLGSSILLEPITLGGAALIAGGTALANWLFNKEQGSSNVGRSKELMDYQMNKQQQYQRWLSAMQFPSMVASLRSAGLNPNLALGGTPSQPMASAPSATQNMSPSQIDLLGAAQSYSQMELLQAQKENIEADTKEKQAGAAQKWAQTDLLDQQVLTGLQTWAKDMEEKQSRIDVNKANIGKIEQEIKVLAKTEDELISKIKLNDKLVEWNQKQIDNYDNYMRAVIREKVASASFLSAQAQSELRLLMYKEFNYSAMSRMYNANARVGDSQVGVNNAQVGLINVNKTAQEITNKYDLRYGDVQRVVGIVTDVVGTAAQCTSAGGLLMMGMNKSFSNPFNPKRQSYSFSPGDAFAPRYR